MVEIATPTPTGAARLVEMLERLGVELVFGLPGVHNLPIWKALSDSEIRLVGVRHEQTAAYAADGYARATGRLGVAVVTTGPGAANTLGGTGEAMAAGSPVLVIATDISTAFRREGVYRGTLHETRDQTAMFVPVTKAARLVGSAEEIADAALESGRRARRADRTGLPRHPNRPAVEAGRAARVPAPPPVAGTRSAAERIDRACELLAGPQRPLIWAGGGALRAGAGAGRRARAQAGRAGDHDLHGSRAAARPITRARSPALPTRPRSARCGTKPTWCSRSGPTSTARTPRTGRCPSRRR